MPQRFTDNSRLQRARRISNNKVPVYNKISSDPVIVYAEIKGSGSTPYKIMIDLKERDISHDCPDIRKKNGQWCKHLVKVLLMLDTVEVNAVWKSLGKTSKISYRTANLADKVSNYKIEVMGNQKEIDLDENMKLEDLLILGEQLSQKKLPENLIERILKLIEKEMEYLEPLQLATNLNQIFDNTSGEFMQILDKEADQRLSSIVLESLQYYLEWFFVTSTKLKLEITYSLRGLLSKLNIFPDPIFFDLPLDKLEEEDKKELVVVLDLLIEDEDTYKEILDYLKLQYDDKELLDTKRYIANTLRIKGTSHRRLRVWAEANLPYTEWKITRTTNVDDFLIYCLKSVGLQPQININFNNPMAIYTLPNSVLEGESAILFAIRRIIEDDRDYISYDEGKRHPKLIKFLKGEVVDTNWKENIREYSNDSVLSSDGIIIQWDVTGKLHHQEFIHAVNDDFRIIVDPNSPVATKIQPFDFTICRPVLTPINRTLKMAYPEYILSFDQVKNYVKQGIEIVSSVLLMDTMQKYYSGKQINNSDVLLTREMVEKHLFIFGSTDYLTFLEEVENIGVKGISNEDYDEIYTFISNDTGRLNKRSRPKINELLVSEASDLDPVFSLLGIPHDKQQKLTIKALKKSPDIVKFRKIMAKLLAQHIINEKLRNNIIAELGEIEFNLYGGLVEELVRNVEGYFEKIQKKMNQGRLSKRDLRKDRLGEIIAEEASIGHAGSISEDELFGIELIIERFLDK